MATRCGDTTLPSDFLADLLMKLLFVSHLQLLTPNTSMPKPRISVEGIAHDNGMGGGATHSMPQGRRDKHQRAGAAGCFRICFEDASDLLACQMLIEKVRLKKV